MDAPAPAAPTVRRAAMIFIFITVLIDILAFGLIIPVLPHLIEDFVGGDTATAAGWVGIFGTTFAAIQFISSPIQGALSDRFGRRPVILLSCLGLGVDFIFMAVADSLPWLFVGRVISGFTAASFSIANAYIADVVAPENRAKSYGMLGAAFGLGFIIGPVVGGLLGDIDLRAPFWAASVLALANFVYGWFVLPESLPPEKRSPRFDWSHANPIGSLVLIKRYPHVLGLAAVIMLDNLAHYVFPSVFVLYADYRYDWGIKEVGYVLAAVGICTAIVQAGLIGRLVKALGERRALLVGQACGLAGFTLYAFAPSGWMFLAGIPVMAFWGLANPAVQALATRQVDPAEQGRLQGAFMSLASLAGVAAPVMFTGVFAAAIGDYADWHFPGAPFLLSALIVALALWVSHRATRAR
ncbi:MFS transporter [Arenimonas terrae]|uniref:MFS transporter n=2 Tax=Arenimonas terrae TaxID=2546226 RepID=A0A5C4RQR0_9GAMM|nr:MFS transporter [Arenimonas terrae]